MASKIRITAGNELRAATLALDRAVEPSEAEPANPSAQTSHLWPWALPAHLLRAPASAVAAHCVAAAKHGKHASAHQTDFSVVHSYGLVLQVGRGRVG